MDLEKGVSRHGSLVRVTKKPLCILGLYERKCFSKELVEGIISIRASQVLLQEDVGEFP